MNHKILILFIGFLLINFAYADSEWVRPQVTLADLGGNYSAGFGLDLTAGTFSVQDLFLKNYETDTIEGNLYVGTDGVENRKLRVYSDTAGVYLDFASYGDYNQIYSKGAELLNFGVRNANNGYIRFYAGSNDLVMVAKEQGIGIMNAGATPNAELDVSGTIRAEEFCDENGDNCHDISDGLITIEEFEMETGRNFVPNACFYKEYEYWNGACMITYEQNIDSGWNGSLNDYTDDTEWNTTHQYLTLPINSQNWTDIDNGGISSDGNLSGRNVIFEGNIDSDLTNRTFTIHNNTQIAITLHIPKVYNGSEYIINLPNGNATISSGEDIRVVDRPDRCSATMRICPQATIISDWIENIPIGQPYVLDMEVNAPWLIEDSTPEGRIYLQIEARDENNIPIYQYGSQDTSVFFGYEPAEDLYPLGTEGFVHLYYIIPDLSDTENWLSAGVGAERTATMKVRVTLKNQYNDNFTFVSGVMLVGGEHTKAFNLHTYGEDDVISDLQEVSVEDGLEVAGNVTFLSNLDISGDLQAEDYYSGDGTQGITDNTMYFCQVPAGTKCATWCLADIKDGLIVGCS